MPDRHLAARRLLVVTEEELQRIVLDIHDGPVQNIFAALSQLEHVRGRLDELDGVREDCTAPLGRAIDLLETSLNEIRGLMSTLRPVAALSRLEAIPAAVVPGAHVERPVEADAAALIASSSNH